MLSLVKLVSDSEELHKLLLGSYNGAYSLGVGSHDGAEVLILQVEDVSTLPFQQELQTISFKGEQILLSVTPGFKRPSRL